MNAGILLHEVAQQEDGQQHRSRADDGESEEDGTPAVHIRLPAADRRANCRSNGHGDAHCSHSLAAVSDRNGGEYDDLQHWPHHTAAHSLKHAAHNFQRENG